MPIRTARYPSSFSGVQSIRGQFEEGPIANARRGVVLIQKSDIKVGDRIVIHATEMKEKLVAHTVEIGAARQAKQAGQH